MNLKAWLRLMRFPNLLIVALTQYLIYLFVFYLNFDLADLSPTLNSWEFALLVISTICIAAGGYIINDILDCEIDRINKPDRLIIGKEITRTKAKQSYLIIIFLGGIIALHLAIQTDNLPLFILYPIAVLLLYLYSKYFKKSFLIGNWIVGLFCAFVAGIVWVAELPSLKLYQIQEAQKAHYLERVLMFYLLFAFLSTTFRELVKDMEDIEGDRLEGCRTLPIVWSIEKGKWIAVGNALLLFLVVLWLGYYISNYTPLAQLVLAILAIQLPLLYSIIKTIRARTSSDFHSISQTLKIMMLLGLILLFWLA